MMTGADAQRSWRHNICAACWNYRTPGRTPYVLVDPPVELCCFCGQANRDGIYTRLFPPSAELRCHKRPDSHV